MGGLSCGPAAGDRTPSLRGRWRATDPAPGPKPVCEGRSPPRSVRGSTRCSVRTAACAGSRPDAECRRVIPRSARQSLYISWQTPLNDSPSLLVRGLDARLEFLGQQAVRPIEPRTNGSDVAMELCAGVGIRNFTEIAKHDHFAIMRRQGLDGFADQIDGLSTQDLGNRVVT